MQECQWPPQRNHFGGAQSANLLQITFPGEMTTVPLLFYAPGQFSVGEVADAAKTGGWSAEVAAVSKKGVISVIITAAGQGPVLPNQEKGKNNLVTFTFCYAPNTVLNKRQ